MNYTSTCWFPSSYDEDDGSLFGGCSCGVPNTNGIPCHHMCAVVKSYRIDGLNETNVMPIWWHTSHWRKQYPRDSFVFCNTDIQSLCNTARVDSHNSQNKYVLCPPYSGPQKDGRPREEKRIKGFIELVLRRRRRPQRIRKRGRYRLNLMIRLSIGIERGRRRRKRGLRKSNSGPIEENLPMTTT